MCMQEADCFTTHFPRNGNSVPGGVFSSRSVLQDAEIRQLHFHDCLEVGLCECGTGECWVGEERQRFEPGDVQLIFPYQRHLSRADAGQACVWRFVSMLPIQCLSWAGLFKAELAMRLYTADMRVSGIVRREQYPEIARCVGELVREAVEPDGVSEEMLGVRLLELSLLLKRMGTAEKAQDAMARETALCRILPALRLLETGLEGENGRDSLRVADLARACHLCEGYFREQFQLFTGMRPKQAIVRRALARAEAMLTGTRLPVAEIGRRAGFEDFSAFGRSFRAHYGISPSAYRQAKCAQREELGDSNQCEWGAANSSQETASPPSASACPGMVRGKC